MDGFSDDSVDSWLDPSLDSDSNDSWLFGEKENEDAFVYEVGKARIKNTN